ncbi:hypothetical protein CYMTET_5580 [Cymbomonas tetramitiformis]|uniref:Uncharacterized protein n=1 Tax=Cymbomonas tetramitiformis TaxID=36881 RepID=A0AAE0LJB1_9CHLO|nr:hypothetical protein CYMTET_5580 [Cymbomonas tetramitiformis]
MGQMPITRGVERLIQETEDGIIRDMATSEVLAHAGQAPVSSVQQGAAGQEAGHSPQSLLTGPAFSAISGQSGPVPVRPPMPAPPTLPQQPASLQPQPQPLGPASASTQPLSGANTQHPASQQPQPQPPQQPRPEAILQSQTQFQPQLQPQPVQQQQQPQRQAQPFLQQQPQPPLHSFPQQQPLPYSQPQPFLHHQPQPQPQPQPFGPTQHQAQHGSLPVPPLGLHVTEEEDQEEDSGDRIRRMEPGASLDPGALAAAYLSLAQQHDEGVTHQPISSSERTAIRGYQHLGPDVAYRIVPHAFGEHIRVQFVQATPGAPFSLSALDMGTLLLSASEVARNVLGSIIAHQEQVHPTTGGLRYICWFSGSQTSVDIPEPRALVDAGGLSFALASTRPDILQLVAETAPAYLIPLSIPVSGPLGVAPPWASEWVVKITHLDGITCGYDGHLQDAQGPQGGEGHHSGACWLRRRDQEGAMRAGSGAGKGGGGYGGGGPGGGPGGGGGGPGGGPGGEEEAEDMEVDLEGELEEAEAQEAEGAWEAGEDQWVGQTRDCSRGEAEEASR